MSNHKKAQAIKDLPYYTDIWKFFQILKKFSNFLIV